MRSACTPAILAVLLSVCPGARGQSSAPADPGAGHVTFTAHSNLVLLPTLVRNKKGETIYGLKAEQFIVEDNGVRQVVQVDEEPDSSGLSLVVLVQCSRSAPSEFIKLKGLAAMVDAIVGDAPHEVSVVSYGIAPYVLGGFSGSSDSVQFALSRLQPCGYHAASIDAVYYALSMLRRQNNHYRRAILLIGEMRDQGSHAKLHDVVAELGITDTTIYTVAFSPAKDEFIDAFRYGNNSSKRPIFPPPKSAPAPSSTDANGPPPPERIPMFKDKPLLIERLLPAQFIVMINALKRDTASQLASLSGGESFTFSTQRDFEHDLERISNQIHNSYLLRFQPSSGPIMVLHSLTVQVAGYPDAVIQTRRNYWSGIFESPTGSGR
jgi:VWFA-related protein